MKSKIGCLWWNLNLGKMLRIRNAHMLWAIMEIVSIHMYLCVYEYTCKYRFQTYNLECMYSYWIRCHYQSMLTLYNQHDRWKYIYDHPCRKWGRNYPYHRNNWGHMLVRSWQDCKRKRIANIIYMYMYKYIIYILDNVAWNLRITCGTLVTSKIFHATPNKHQHNHAGWVE